VYLTRMGPMAGFYDYLASQNQKATMVPLEAQRAHADGHELWARASEYFHLLARLRAPTF
jgi:hypothetical protein